MIYFRRDELRESVECQDFGLVELVPPIHEMSSRTRHHGSSDIAADWKVRAPGLLKKQARPGNRGSGFGFWIFSGCLSRFCLSGLDVRAWTFGRYFSENS